MSKKQREFAIDNGKCWDSFNLITVLGAYLEGVLEQSCLSYYDQKEMLNRLHQIAGSRNWRAHLRHLAEAEVLDSLGYMVQVLRSCGVNAAADEIDTLLANAKGLHLRARTFDLRSRAVPLAIDPRFMVPSP